MPKTTPLTRDRILAAALDLADTNGIDSLSMRKLAQGLKVEAMSLYNHIRNKEDLLSGMVEAVVAEFHKPDPSGDWRAEMRIRALSAHASLTRHPWAAPLLMGRINDGPHMLAYVDATLGCLASAGFSYAQADRIWNAMDSHIYGFAAQEQKFPFAPEDFATAAQSYLPMIPVGQLPHIHALTSEVASRRHDGIQDIAFGLDLLIDAISRLPQDAVNT